MFRYHFGNGRKKSFIELPDGSNLEPHSTIMSEESSEAINDARSGRSGTVRPFKNRMNESPVSLAVKHSISKNYDLERCQRDCRIWNKVYPHLLAHVLINKKNPKEFRYVMPHLGISLAEFNPATIEENLQIQLVAIKALKQLHRKGVAHGDINLGNILITKVISSGTISYQAYIIDFESSHTTDVPDSDTLKSRTKDDIQNKMRMDIAKLAHILNYFHDKPKNVEQIATTSPFSFSDSALKISKDRSLNASGEKDKISDSVAVSSSLAIDSIPFVGSTVASSQDEDLQIERIELLSQELISPAEEINLLIESFRTKLSLASKAVVPFTAERTDTDLSKKGVAEWMPLHFGSIDVNHLDVDALLVNASYRLAPSITERMLAQLKHTIFFNRIFSERSIDKSLVKAPVHFSAETVQQLKHSQLSGFFTKRFPLVKPRVYDEFDAVVQELRKSEDNNIKLPESFIQ